MFVKNVTDKIRKYSFTFTELVKRDFMHKYKRSILGMGWSILFPLLQLLVMRLVFTKFFGNEIEHYTTYLFCGNLVFNFYRESTNGGMNSLMSNANIFSKINVPKHLFLLSKNVSSLINFGLTLCVFLIFALIDKVHFTWMFFALIYPIICLVIFSIGVGLILSALYVFFRDITYLYDIFTMLLMYVSAIFYKVDRFDPTVQKIFLLNPVYCYIKYFRVVVLEGKIPSLQFHLLCLGYALLIIFIGGLIYRKNNHKFLYYV